MMSISAVNSNQISAVNRETVTSAKTVHIKDVSTLKATLKDVKNSIEDFCKGLDKPGIFKPGEESFKRLRAALERVNEGATTLLSKLDGSSYQHHASKRTNLEKINVDVDLLLNKICSKFKGSQQQAQFNRENEDRYRANQAERAKANFERKQHANQMIKAGRGDELYNGGMVK
ncbi:hypothetical protein J5069_14870 [Candidatus Symbiopectobacterium sp. NZEC127]|uniref:hypothetical protein n=1 Tax=Candidatus Symbiopectobacterium sp. NZEC127 TaxID=2820472 RepID=UPI002227DD52|nr:hypothetical protein [Candidatus Symbiopectobacterium sp. NZEC127]MCW2487177.1 hypothetical protein [Candidatus Symbiopectobacterium sp. NZEC127]